MKNRVFEITLSLFSLLFFLSCSDANQAFDNTTPANIYKEDFLQASRLIANNYIYLERKLDISRKQFVDNMNAHADAVDWSHGKDTFTREIRNLTAMLADGHVDWSIDIENQQPKAWYLGFIATYKNDNKITVAKVHRHYQDQLNIGDQIIKWNGADINQTLNELISLYPQSTKSASAELAARQLSTEYSFRPLRSNLSPVQITILDTQGNEKTATLLWQRMRAALDNQFVNSDETVLLTRSLIPSLEDIPAIHQETSASLIYYFIEAKPMKFAVLHPRDFYNWNIEELDQALKTIINAQPDLLIVDLKDTAGGAFQQVVYLSHALNVQDNFEFFYDMINPQTHLRTTGIDDFKFIADEINLKYIWKGQVLFRINPLTKSGGDFFIRKMQLANRGIIFGQPSAGAGGGTDSFILANTQTELSLPLRERILKEDHNSIEGHAIMPDTLYDGDLTGFLEQLTKN